MKLENKIIRTAFFLAALTAFINPLVAQSTNQGQSRRAFVLEEKKDDPYLPNKYGNALVSPAYRSHSGTAFVPATSTVFTTQVNVNSSGQNIIGDAANEPSIAVDPSNPMNVVIGWRQFDNVASNFRQAGWGYSNDGGQTWTAPGKIEPGVFRSDPVLDYDDSGNFYYNSLTNTPSYNCKVFKSSNGGVSWNSGTNAFGGDKQWMAIDRSPGTGNDNIYSFWTSNYSVCPPFNFTRSEDVNITYDNCILVAGDPYWGTMAVSSTGELFVAGGTNNDSLQVVRSANAQSPGSNVFWDLNVSVYMDGYLNGFIPVNPAGLLGQVNIALDNSTGPGQGNVYLAASLTRLSNFDQGDAMFARSTDGGLTWSAPLKLNDDNSFNNTQWLTTMSVAPNGRIDVVWLDTREDNFGLDSSALYYTYSIDQGMTWSVNEKISPLFDPHIGYPNQDKMGDYFEMISDNNGAHLAWANTLNGEEDVYYSYIMPNIPIGLNEVAVAPDVTVYPNPGNGLFRYQTSVPVEQIRIFDLVGKEVMIIKNPMRADNFDISDHPSGIYFAEFKFENGTGKVQKLIIEQSASAE